MCVCINDSDKPEEVHPEEWIVKGKEYEITHVYYHELQLIQGVLLKEVKMTKRSEPYCSYKLSRFAVTLENFRNLIQMMKDCSELNEVDIKKLLRESELQVVE